MIAALLWLAAGGVPVTLMDDVLEAPPGGWRAIAIALRQRPAAIDCQYQMRRGPPVRLWLLDRRDLPGFETGRGVRPLAMTGYTRAGGLRHNAGLGDFVLIVDNRLNARAAAEVYLRVLLDFSAVQVRELTPERRAVVVSLSLLFFAATVYWAARRLGPKLWARLRQ